MTLARLNRPEDYERVLWNKVRDAQPNISPLARSMNLTDAGPLDHTRALPEPGEGVDINLYLDLHLKLGERLRAKGWLSPVNQVAGICMLGRWCAERNLTEKANALLNRAEEVSAGMLLGRLYVADLQRLLGHEDAAQRIEEELLGYDLLPLPRVTAALEHLAAQQGAGMSDAAAFRVASYSNDPRVLPQALRHAIAKGMKTEQEDLAERLRKVTTLFSPNANK